MARGLGKGLDALIPSTVSENVLEAARKALIHIQKIVPIPPK